MPSQSLILSNRPTMGASPTTFCKQKYSTDPLKSPTRWGLCLPLMSYVKGRVDVIGKAQVTGSKRITRSLRSTRGVSVSGILIGFAGESSARIGKSVLIQTSGDDHHVAVGSCSARFIELSRIEWRTTDRANRLFAPFYVTEKAPHGSGAEISPILWRD